MRPPKSRAAPLELRESATAADPSTLGEVELVARVVSRSRRFDLVVAARVLECAGGLAGVARLGAGELAQVSGVDREVASRLAAAVELGRRVAASAVARPREVLGSFEAVERWARPRLAALDHEEVWLLSLDGRNGLKAARRIAQGGAHGCALTPRDVLAPAVRDGSSAIVLVHNHPSGDPTPSPEDLAMTEAVVRACEVIGVPLLDHVVVARGGGASVFDLLEDR